MKITTGSYVQYAITQDLPPCQQAICAEIDAKYRTFHSAINQVTRTFLDINFQ
jgi:hypothetical protein